MVCRCRSAHPVPVVCISSYWSGGANQTFATAFLIAAPVIGFDALFISLPLLGWQMLLVAYCSGSLFLPLTIAWLLGCQFKGLSGAPAEATLVDEKATARFASAVKQGYLHQLDHTAPWVLFGCALAATLSAVSVWAFFEQALWLQVLVMVIVAFPFALCATGNITPVIAVLLIAGLSPGAAMAFFLIAPTISLELLKIVKQQQGIFAAISLAMLMTVAAFLIGLGLNQYIDVIALPWLAQEQESLQLVATGKCGDPVNFVSVVATAPGSAQLYRRVDP